MDIQEGYVLVKQIDLQMLISRVDSVERNVNTTLAEISNDSLIPATEAIVASGLSNSQFYAYVHEGIIKQVGNSKLYSLKECRTAKARKKLVKKEAKA